MGFAVAIGPGGRSVAVGIERTAARGTNATGEARARAALRTEAAAHHTLRCVAHEPSLTRATGATGLHGAAAHRHRGRRAPSHRTYECRRARAAAVRCAARLTVIAAVHRDLAQPGPAHASHCADAAHATRHAGRSAWRHVDGDRVDEPNVRGTRVERIEPHRARIDAARIGNIGVDDSANRARARGEHRNEPEAREQLHERQDTKTGRAPANAQIGEPCPSNIRIEFEVSNRCIDNVCASGL